MNVYRIVEDGEASCVVAPNMMVAIGTAQEVCLKEDDELTPEYYQVNILESCQFIGVLRNEFVARDKDEIEVF